MDDYKKEYKELKISNENNICISASKESENLYYLYEYSENNNLILDAIQYPGLLNYVRAGILTEKEIDTILLNEKNNGKRTLQ